MPGLNRGARTPWIAGAPRHRATARMRNRMQPSHRSRTRRTGPTTPAAGRVWRSSSSCAPSWRRLRDEALRERAELDNQRKRLARDVEHGAQIRQRAPAGRPAAGVRQPRCRPDRRRRRAEPAARRPGADPAPVAESRRRQRPERGRPGRRDLQSRTAPGDQPGRGRRRGARQRGAGVPEGLPAERAPAAPGPGRGRTTDTPGCCSMRIAAP